jgi:hypothetical protein
MTENADYDRALDNVVRAATATIYNDNLSWEAAWCALAEDNRDTALTAAIHLAANLAQQTSDQAHQAGHRIPPDSATHSAAEHIRHARRQQHPD